MIGRKGGTDENCIIVGLLHEFGVSIGWMEIGKEGMKVGRKPSQKKVEKYSFCGTKDSYNHPNKACLIFFSKFSIKIYIS